MDVTAMLSELVAQRDQLTAAINVLERLAMVGGAMPKRRGRPPKNPLNVLTMSHPKSAAPNTEKKRGGRTWTPAQKRTQAEAIKKRWAAKKRAEKRAVTAKSAAKSTAKSAKPKSKPKPKAKKTPKPRPAPAPTPAQEGAEAVA